MTDHTSASASASAPIGVFDSGLGGLTVVRALARRLPHESLLYFGDTARVPYGPKSPETIRRYSREIATYLCQEGVKAIVVACNTATAHALPMLRDEFALPIIGVIDPGARAAVAATRTRCVGVIGTTGTVASGAYERAIHGAGPDVQVIARACPLFVPLVEEGWLDTDATHLIAHEYLDTLVSRNTPETNDSTADHAHAMIDTLVLGCTHYPLLERVIRDVVGPRVQLVDSADAAAAETARQLSAADLSSADHARPTYRFVASDAPDHFLRAGRRFLGNGGGSSRVMLNGVETVTLG